MNVKARPSGPWMHARHQVSGGDLNSSVVLSWLLDHKVRASSNLHRNLIIQQNADTGLFLSRDPITRKNWRSNDQSTRSAFRASDEINDLSNRLGRKCVSSKKYK